VKVTVIGGGGSVTTVALVKAGNGYTTGAGKVTSTTGGGTGCTINITSLVSTFFTTELFVGELIVVSGQQARRIVQIISNTQLIISTPWSPDLSASVPFVSLGGLTGGSFSDVVLPLIGVFITTADETWARLVEAITVHSTSVFAEFDAGANTVTVHAIETGLAGNDVVFDTAGAPPVVLTPAMGFLSGGTDTHAGGHIEYTGQPADGETVTVGGVIYEFDNNGLSTIVLDPQAGTVTTTGVNVVGVGTVFTSLSNFSVIDVSGQQRQIIFITDDTHLTVGAIFSPDLVASAYSIVNLGTFVITIGATADATYATLADALVVGAVVTVTQDTVNGRLDLVAVVAGTVGNSIVFSGSITNAALVPSGGFLSAAVDGDFTNPDAPTCNEVSDFINAHTTGLTATCETDNRITLTSDETGLKSAIIIGHGSANGILGFESDKGKTNSEAGARPAWRLNVGKDPRAPVGKLGMGGVLTTVFTP
jgi:hypothetical protein